MTELFTFLPTLSEPLTFGCFGAAFTLAGSMLRSGLNRTPRKIGGYFCVFGLALMAMGFLCITSDMSFLALAHRG